MAKNGKAVSSPLNDELKVIRRVVRALDGLNHHAKTRVLNYVLGAAWAASSPSDTLVGSTPMINQSSMIAEDAG